jgi:hypothetical protein
LIAKIGLIHHFVPPLADERLEDGDAAPEDVVEILSGDLTIRVI